MTDLFTTSNRWLAAAVILLVGAFVAGLVGALVTVISRRVPDGGQRVGRLAAPAVYAVIAATVVVALLRVAAPASAELGLRTAAISLLAGLPGVLVALVLLVLGIAVATAVRAIVRRVLDQVQPGTAEVLSTAAYWAVVGLTILLAAEQAGLRTGLVQALLVVVVGAVALALSLSVGLGSRALIAAVVAGRHVAQVVAVGDDVEVDGLRGTVTALGHASVRLAVPGGAEAEVPNDRFLAGTVLVHRRAAAAETAPIQERS